MGKRRKRIIQPISLTVGDDPTLWRFDRLHDALAANTRTLGQLIKAGEILANPDTAAGEPSENNPFDQTPQA